MQSPTVLKTDVNAHSLRMFMKFCIYFNADLAISNCQFVKNKINSVKVNVWVNVKISEKCQGQNIKLVDMFWLSWIYFGLRYKQRDVNEMKINETAQTVEM